MSLSAWGRWWRGVGCLVILALGLLTQNSFGAEEDLWSQVRIQGEWVYVDLSFRVQASRALVWEVLTDFDHMVGFVSNLTASSVLAREGLTLQVSQKGEARRGLLAFPFESVREIRLTPKSRIESRLIRGSMEKQTGFTELSGDGLETRVVFHGESVPGVWIPPVIGKRFIEQELREQFLEIRAEVLRRQGQAGP